jgi:hypothetical protein
LSRWVPVIRAPFFRSVIRDLLQPLRCREPVGSSVRAMIVHGATRGQEIHSVIGERFARMDHADG